MATSKSGSLRNREFEPIRFAAKRNHRSVTHEEVVVLGSGGYRAIAHLGVADGGYTSNEDAEVEKYFD